LGGERGWVCSVGEILIFRERKGLEGVCAELVRAGGINGVVFRGD
jgi:hypothetical protein